MLAIDKRRQPIDVIALADELKIRGALPRLEGGESYLMTLANGGPDRREHRSTTSGWSRRRRPCAG